MPRKTHVYIDGFNFYYGALKKSPYRWINLRRLSEILLSDHDVKQIRYFTAEVEARDGDLRQPQRQQLILRALRTLENFSIHYGRFLSSQPWMRLVDNPERTVRVMKTEEKGSDVNLATYLLVDAFREECDCAVVISNDSDLKEPIRFVREALGKPVGVIYPRNRISQDLQNVSTFTKRVRTGVLVASQFDKTLSDDEGRFEIPPEWELMLEHIPLAGSLCEAIRKKRLNEIKDFLKRGVDPRWYSADCKSGIDVSKEVRDKKIKAVIRSWLDKNGSPQRRYNLDLPQVKDIMNYIDANRDALEKSHSTLTTLLESLRLD